MFPIVRVRFRGVFAAGGELTVYGFVGPSGTGKSHHALDVARRFGVSYILDDGLLIRENRVLAGSSAKREASRIASVRRALYTEQSHAEQVGEALAGSGAQSVMILGTSAHMVDEIAKRLKLPPIDMYIDIGDMVSDSDIEAARAVRRSEGKHVIPAPTFALKKEFSGYFLAPLRHLVRRGKKAGAGTGVGAGAGERTVVRPTFSYLGGYSISRSALEQLAACVAMKSAGVAGVMDVNVDFAENRLDIAMSLCIKYGVGIRAVLAGTAKLIRAEMDRQTSLHIREVSLTAKSLDVKQNAY
ncbi:MAG: hypothetical protein FWH01_01130 [Oscillospiraceae bacterium]|nr:hypothetical protein [Oscillospiraceae bacterium]